MPRNTPWTRSPFDTVLDTVRTRIARHVPSAGEAALGAEEMASLRELAAREIEAYNAEASGAGRPPLDGSVEALAESMLHEIFGLGPLERLLAAEEVEDIYILGPDKVLVVTSDGRRTRAQVDFGSRDRLMSLARRALAAEGKRVDFLHPFADVRLHDGSRLHVSVHPCAEPSPQIVIRRHRRVFGPGDDRLARLVALGSMGEDLAHLLRRAMAARVSMLVAGATAAGKTTLINALGGKIDPTAAVVCIEDVRELEFPGVNVSYLLTRLPSPEGRGAITQRYLVQQALRKRADWIVLGEARGDEAWDFAQAGNTGHAILGSVHANGTMDAIERYRDLCLQSADNLREAVALRGVARAFRMVIFLRFDPAANRRVVHHVAEVCGVDGDGRLPRMRDLYAWNDATGVLEAVEDGPSAGLAAALDGAG